MTSLDPAGPPTSAPLADVVAATAAERDATPSGRLTELGQARRDLERTTPFVNVFVVETGERRLGTEALTQMYLSRAAVGATQARVTRAHSWDGPELRIEVETDRDLDGEVGVPQHTGVRLFAGTSRALPVKALAERLAGLRHPGLGAAFLAAPAPLGTPTGTAVPAPGNGVQVIWGSPELRAEALGAAAAELLAAGRRLLIVSADNVALDRTAAAAHRWAGQPPAGTIVRVGVPSSRPLADDDRLTVDGAAARRAPDALAEAADAANELKGLLATAQATRAEWEAAPPVRPEELRTARAELSEVEADLAAALADAKEAASAHGAARRSSRELDVVRTAFRRVDEFARTVQEASAEAAASASGVARMADEVGGDARRPAAATATQLVVAAEVATARLDRRDHALAALQGAVGHAATLGVSRSQLQLFEERLREARAAHATVERAALAARAKRARCAARVTELQRVLAMASAPAGGGRPDGPPIAPDALRELRTRHQRARAVVNGQQAPALAEARVVVTTFGHLVANPAVYEQAYDHVVVEGANAVAPVYVLWAASRATQAVTLATGPGEVPPAPEAAGLPPHLLRWLSAPVLALMGFGGEAAVRAHPGTMALD